MIRRMRKRTWTVGAMVLMLLATGCAHRRSFRFGQSPSVSPSNSECQPACDAQSMAIEYPDLCEPAVQPPPSIAPRPADSLPTEFWDLSLDEAIERSLRTKVIADLGGRIISNPESITTAFDPAIQESDPIFGVQAALSEFDASLASQFLYSKNDRVFNNQIIGGGVQQLTQDTFNFQTELSKTAATGTRFSIRQQTAYDSNNRLGNRFPSAYETQWQSEVRHPLLQGAGIEFNRIAGPNAQPGLRFRNGILIARINTDISLADLEMAVRNRISQVEDAYWQLYLAYRTYDARRKALEAVTDTYRRAKSRADAGGYEGGEIDTVFQAKGEVLNNRKLLSDALLGEQGVYQAERTLRQLISETNTDVRLIRPSDEPTLTPMTYDWESLRQTAFEKRAELRRQAWKVKQEELRVLAAKNFLLPGLDAIARHRLRGFGDDLMGNGGNFASAHRDLTSLDHQEWEFGLELNVPLGYRQALAGVRNARLNYARERAVLLEQQQAIDLALHLAIQTQVNAWDQLRQIRELVDTNQLDVKAKSVRCHDLGEVTVDELLRAQQRLFDSELEYHTLRVEHAVAVKNVSLESGTLLDLAGVVMNEQPSCDWEYADACRNQRRTNAFDYRCQIPAVVATRNVYSTSSAADDVIVLPHLDQESSPDLASPAVISDPDWEALPSPGIHRLPDVIQD